MFTAYNDLVQVHLSQAVQYLRITVIIMRCN